MGAKVYKIGKTATAYALIALFGISVASIGYATHGCIRALTAEMVKTNNHQEASLLRELRGAFDSDDRPNPYRGIYMTIDRCEPIYTSWGGEYDFGQINSYLGFLDELNFYHNLGVLSEEAIEQGFGYNIIEAWEYPEMQRYVQGMRANAKENTAFDGLEFLAKTMEAKPKYAAFAKHIRAEYAACYGKTRK